VEPAEFGRTEGDAILFETIPLRWFDPLRRAFLASRHGTLPRKALTAALKLASRRRLDADIDVISPADQPGLRFVNCDSMLVPYIYWFGKNGYEGTLVDWWRFFCARATQIVEIGANIGFYTVEGAQTMAAGGTYRAVEPIPQVADILRRNVRLNALTRVEVVEAAVVASENAGMVDIVVPDERWALTTGAFIPDAAEGLNRRARTRITVQTVGAQRLLKGADLIKIDAEGIEYDLLQAAKPMLVKSRPIILVEVLPGAKRLQAFIKAFAQEAGYFIYALPGYTYRDLKLLPAASFNAEHLSAHNARDVILAPNELGRSSPPTESDIEPI
jgi:FkbM family methyltransferase